MKIVAILKRTTGYQSYEPVGCRYTKKNKSCTPRQPVGGREKENKTGKDGLNMKSYGAREDEFSTRQRALLLQQAFEDMPSKIALFKRCFCGEASPRSAIKGHCLICNWGNHMAIRDCTADGCMLWQYRPFTDSKGKKSAAN